MLKLRRRRSRGADQEPEIPMPDWEKLSDGRLWRLKRGKHWAGNPAILLHEARLAAHKHDQRAFSYHDRLGKFEYIWLQFLDGRLELDDPCRRCGGTDLQRVQEYFLRCTACGALHKLRDGEPTTNAAEFVSVRVLSLDGTEIDEMRVVDEATVEAVCEFHRPVAAAHLSFVFYAGRRKALHSGCPDLIEVPTADTVRIRLNLDARVLSAGDYSIVAKLELVLDEKDRRFHSIRPPQRANIRVLDPIHLQEPTQDHRSRLEWSAVSALDESPMPVLDYEKPEDDDDEAEDEQER
jgi:hypothetical protein